MKGPTLPCSVCNIIHIVYTDFIWEWHSFPVRCPYTPPVQAGSACPRLLVHIIMHHSTANIRGFFCRSSLKSFGTYYTATDFNMLTGTSLSACTVLQLHYCSFVPRHCEHKNQDFNTTFLPPSTFKRGILIIARILLACM